MAASSFRCPRCSRRLEKGAAAFVLGAAGYSPKPTDPLPAAVTCPGCGFAIPTADMIAGRFDERPDWLTPAACFAGACAAFAAFYGRLYSGPSAVGIGFAVLFAVVGAVELGERLWRAVKDRR